MVFSQVKYTKISGMADYLTQSKKKPWGWKCYMDDTTTLTSTAPCSSLLLPKLNEGLKQARMKVKPTKCRRFLSVRETWPLCMSVLFYYSENTEYSLDKSEGTLVHTYYPALYTTISLQTKVIQNTLSTDHSTYAKHCQTQYVCVQKKTSQHNTILSSI